MRSWTAAAWKETGRFWVDGKLHKSVVCLGSQKGQLHPGEDQAHHSTASELREMTVPLHNAMLQPHTESHVKFWASQYRKDIKLLERVQKRVTKMVKCLESRTSKKWLGSLGLFSLEKAEG